MTKAIKIYMPFVKTGFQNTLAYKFNFIFWFISQLLYCFVMYYLWKAVFNSSANQYFLGFTLNDMVVYLFITTLTAHIASSSATDLIAEEVKNGSFSMRMIKPVNFDLSLLFSELGGIIVIFVVAFVPIITGVEIFKFFNSEVYTFSIVNLLLLLFSTALSYLLNFYLGLCIGAFAFFLKNLWGFIILKDSIISFLSGAIIPIAFIPWKSVRIVFEILPFSSLSYTPVMIYMGKYSPSEIIIKILLQIFWVIVFIIFSKLIFKSAFKHLTVQGG